MSRGKEPIHAKHGGLTKREYFAGLTLQALLSDGLVSRSHAVEQAVKIADELLAELEKSDENKDR